MADTTNFLSEITRTRTLLKQQQKALEETRQAIAESRRLRQERMDCLLKTVAGGDTQRRLLEQSSEAVSDLEQTKNVIIQSTEPVFYLDRFYKEVIRAQEEERSRIARELHDEFGQVIIAIRNEMQLALADGLDLESPLGRRLLSIKDMLEKAGQEIQRLAYDLRPTVLNDFGLIPALTSLAKDFTERTNIQVRFNILGDNRSIPSEVELTLYRIAQEALTNVAKHSCATDVQITLWRLKSSVELVIEDNGIGFYIDGEDGSNGGSGMGLLGMRERLRLFGGKLTIDSSPGRGTELHAQVKT